MKSFNDARVLVTGSNGFIASHLIPDLLNAGAKVTGISLGSKPRRSFKNFSYYSVDLSNKKELNALIRKIRPEKIFHLAGYLSTSLTFDNTDKCIRNNIQATVNLIHALESVPYDAFIYIGSYEEYSGNKIPFKETDGLYPISPYAVSKASAEMFCKAYQRLFGFPITLVRLALTYGPGQQEDGLLAYVIKSCLAKTPPELTGGEQKRELIYVSDVVDALQKIALNEKLHGEIINVGTGVEHSLRDVVNLALKLMQSGITPKWGVVPYRKHEIWSMLGSTAKARRVLNWKPKVSLSEGLAKTISSYKNETCSQK